MTSDHGQRSPALVLVAQIAVILFFFGLWEAATRLGWSNPSLFGQPTRILAALVKGLTGEGVLWRELGWTMMATVLAFLVGSGLALLLGMVFVIFPFSEKVSEPLLNALNSMPRIALAPLQILWFGLGIGSKVAIGASLTFFIVLQSVVAGGRSINPDHVTLCKSLDLKPMAFFWQIMMPTAVPTVFSGLRLGMMYALLGVVAGEIIASEHGLGQQVAYLTSAFDINGVWAVVFLLSMVGMAISSVLATMERRLLSWR